jgi:hypothetical protein
MRMFVASVAAVPAWLKSTLARPSTAMCTTRVLALNVALVPAVVVKDGDLRTPGQVSERGPGSPGSYSEGPAPFDARVVWRRHREAPLPGGLLPISPRSNRRAAGPRTARLLSSGRQDGKRTSGSGTGRAGPGNGIGCCSRSRARQCRHTHVGTTAGRGLEADSPSKL